MATARLCSIEGCDKPHCAKGYCRRHYSFFVRGHIGGRKYAGELQGKRFGKLLVVEYATQSPWKAGWRCVCDCGGERILTRMQLKRKLVQSCGCLRGDHLRVHDACDFRAYNCWQSAKSRCYNEANRGYANYGGRGIRMCDRWRNSFANFLEDMGEKPEGLTLDRIDVNGDYEPGNCRWANALTQGRNRRNVLQLADFKMVMDMHDSGMSRSEIGQKLGLPVSTVGNRLAKARLLCAS